MYTNSGMSVINELGDLLGVSTVWLLHMDGIANSLLFQGVKAKKGYLIEYDTSTKATVFKEASIIAR